MNSASKVKKYTLCRPLKAIADTCQKLKQRNISLRIKNYIKLISSLCHSINSHTLNQFNKLKLYKYLKKSKNEARKN